jgi:acyl-homoserine lactone acylase PvdQ
VQSGNGVYDVIRLRREMVRGGGIIVAVVAGAVAAASCVAPAGPGVGDVGSDPAQVEVWTVLPPGNGYPAGATVDNRDDQRLLYEGLDDAVARGALRDADLGRHFKDARIDLPAPEAALVQRPTPEVEVRWDRWGVPHVVGDSATDVALGAGYATMEGRALVAELARHVGRLGGQELGTDDLFDALDPARRIDYTDAELESRIDELVAEAPGESAPVLAELDAYLEGVNLWVSQHPEHTRTLELLGLPAGQWTRADSIAALLTVVTGNATGGEELANAAALEQLTDRLGPQMGDLAYRDFRAADAPTSTHVEGSYSYPLFADGSGPESVRHPASAAVPDTPAALAAVTTTQTRKPGHSNVVAVTAERTASGSPILVGGPQNGLTSPSLLFEMSLSGGGYRSRGVVLPGAGPYVFVGRSDEYAWTSTSGEGDQVDTRAELLCEPDGSEPSLASAHYLFDGNCIAFDRPPVASAKTVPRTVHGPVIERGLVGGRPVAFSLQRASAGSELFAALAARRLNRSEVSGPDDFVESMRWVTFSGHWFYVDADHIAYRYVGRYPVRATGVTTELPSWGTGEWEWDGWVPQSELPSSVDPDSGCLHSWNNKAAPGWSTADDDWGNVGPHRVDLLVDPVCGRRDLTLAEVVAAHTDAGSTDLRGAEVLPVVLEVLDGSPAPTAHLDSVRALLADWVDSGAHRRDIDRDLFHDHPAVALMDELFEPLVLGVFEPRLGDAMDVIPLRIDAGARTTSSSFGYGWYGLLTRDLERLLGGPDQGAAMPVHCGNGDLDQCRAVIWDAVAGAAWRVGQFQLPWHRGEPERWLSPTVPGDQVLFLPVVFDPVAMRWSNRPAYEMAVQFR